MRAPPRAIYYRRATLARLADLALGLPLRVRDTGAAFAVLVIDAEADTPPLIAGRFQVVAAFLTGYAHGWTYAIEGAARPRLGAE